MSLFYKLLLAPIVEADIFCFLVVLQTTTSSPPKKTQQQQFGKFNITFQCFILKNMRKNLPMLYNNRICSPGYSGSQCFVRIFASWGGTSWYDSFHGCDSGLVWNVPFWRLDSFKGQLISKCLFVVFNFFQKTNKNTSHSSKNEFIHSFFGRIHGLTFFFRN